MPTIAERMRGAAGRAGRALLQFSASTHAAPSAPGFEPVARDHADRSEKQAKALRSPAALYGRTTYNAGPSHARYSSYPGTGLEPEQIWNLQLLRNQGYPQLWTELLDQVLERDGHLGGIFDTRRQSVADKPYRVHPAYRGDPLSDALAKVVERVIDKVDDFDQTIEDLLSATAYGYALSEIVWRDMPVRIPTGDGKSFRTVNFTVPRKIEWVHPKHIRFDRWTDEPYLWMPEGEATIPENKFIFHAAAGTGLIEKRGFMGSCVWLSSAKRWSERDWLVYGKIYGIPQILAQYPDGEEEYEKHRAVYEQGLKDWGEGIPLLLPDSWKVDISREAGGRSGDLHGSLIGWANQEMSKRVLGSTLTVEIGNVGAYAAADTHRDAPYLRARADARKLAGTFRWQLHRAIINVNRQVLSEVLGEKPDDLLERIPPGSWRIERESNPIDRLKIWASAVNELGVASDEEQFRDEFGIDAPRPGGNPLKGKPVPIGSGGLAPSLEASEDGADPAPNEGDGQATTSARPALPPSSERLRKQARKTPRGPR